MSRDPETPAAIDLDLAEKTAALEALAAGTYGDGAISEVIRPAAVLPEDAARSVLAELALRDVRAGGLAGGPHVLAPLLRPAYGTPMRYEITIYRATITQAAADAGWTVTRLCDEAMGLGGLSLLTCPRTRLRPPHRPFRLL